MIISTGVYFMLGAFSAISFIVTLYRTGFLRRFLGYPVWLDIAGVCLMVLMLHGSTLGMLTGIMGALFFSAGIGVLRFFCGYERLQRRLGKWVWVSCRPPLGGFGSVLSFYSRGGRC